MLLTEESVINVGSPEPDIKNDDDVDKYITSEAMAIEGHEKLGQKSGESSREWLAHSRNGLHDETLPDRRHGMDEAKGTW